MAKITSYDHKVRALKAVADRMARDMEDHPVARRLQAEINRLHTGAAALENLRAHRSPLDTPAAHVVKVTNKAKQFDREIIAVMNRLGEIVRGGLQDAERRIGEKVKLKPPPEAEAREIREVFRQMNRQDRLKTLGELVEHNRGPEMAALVDSSSLLTGLSDQERADFRKAIISRHASAELAEYDGLENVFDQGFAATNIAAGLVKAVVDPSQVAQIEREAAEADAASAAFDQAIQPQ